MGNTHGPRLYIYTLMLHIIHVYPIITMMNEICGTSWYILNILTVKL